MELPIRPQGAHPAPSSPISVDELLARVAAERPAPATDAVRRVAMVSVAALLRREGWAPHRAGRQMAPRGHTDPPPAPPEPPGLSARRAAAATGALLAAGAVFGTTLVDNSAQQRSGADPDVRTALPQQRSGSESTPGADGTPDTVAIGPAAVQQVIAEAIPPAAGQPADAFVIASGADISQTFFPAVRGEVANPGAVSSPVGPADVDTPAPNTSAPAGQPAAPATGSGTTEGSGERISFPSIETPDVSVSETRLGSAELGPAAVTLPDVTIGGAKVEASADAPVSVELPSVEVSGAELDTPDVRLGPVEVEVPDVKLPPVELPAVALGGEKDNGDKDNGDKDKAGGDGDGPLAAVTDVVDSVLAGDDDAADERVDDGERLAERVEEDSVGATTEDDSDERSVTARVGDTVEKLIGRDDNDDSNDSRDDSGDEPRAKSRSSDSGESDSRDSDDSDSASDSRDSEEDSSDSEGLSSLLDSGD